MDDKQQPGQRTPFGTAGSGQTSEPSYGTDQQGDRRPSPGDRSTGMGQGDQGQGQGTGYGSNTGAQQGSRRGDRAQDAERFPPRPPFADADQDVHESDDK